MSFFKTVSGNFTTEINLSVRHWNWWKISKNRTVWRKKKPRQLSRTKEDIFHFQKPRSLCQNCLKCWKTRRICRILLHDHQHRNHLHQILHRIPRKRSLNRATREQRTARVTTLDPQCRTLCRNHPTTRKYHRGNLVRIKYDDEHAN